MTDDDQGWIERSLQGDHEAFETLVRRYQRMIYSLAYRMSGTAADVEDLTQETFILAQEHLSKFRVEPRFIPPDGMVTATADSK
ncbi:MAG: helix-turn-helix domain-containing protein [Verrucomicrobia bacterium]|nr:helix-turn-helix domain-containing protein [Verrucomicrobiota bacterium]